MTSKTTEAGEQLNTLSSSELDAIEAALSIAAQHYSTMADILKRSEFGRDDYPVFYSQFQKQADEARALVLRIQANR